MVTIVMPTKNRPYAVGRWLAYMNKFYPSGNNIIIADGSEDHYRQPYLDAIKPYRSELNLEYRCYPSELSPFDRYIDALNSINDEVILPSADDDYPIMETHQQGVDFLSNNNDYIAAVSPHVFVTCDKSNGLHLELSHAFEIRKLDSIARVNQYTNSQFPTFYSVIRREHLIERTAVIKNLLVSGFGDYLMGVIDCINGKLKLIEEFNFFRTRNEGHSYYVVDDLFFHVLENGDKVLEISQYLSEQISRHSNSNNREAEKIAQHLIKQQLGRQFSIVPFSHQHKPPSQLSMMKNLLTNAGNPNPKFKYFKQLLFVCHSVTKFLASNDNQNETNHRQYF